MIGTPAHPPTIAPLPASPDRPLWSVMIPTYNCARYLGEALASVLAQDPGPEQMQIEVVDDCSDDEPEAVVEQVGGGRVGFHRHPRNLGHTRTFNTCIERARGRLVHLLHGDDTVRVGFYATMATPFARHPEIGAAFCRYISMDAEGNWETIAPLEPGGRGVLDGWLDRIALGQRLQPPTIVVRRSVYEALGGFDPRAGLAAEDWEMWVRIAARFPVWYEPEPLACYRVHDASITSSIYRTARDVRELREAIELVCGQLPPNRAPIVRRKAREVVATTALRRAGRMLHRGDKRAALAQVREALRTSRSPAVLERLAFFCALWLRRAISGRRSR